MEERIELLTTNDINVINLLASSMSEEEFDNLLIEYLINQAAVNNVVYDTEYRKSNQIITGGVKLFWDSNETLIVVRIHESMKRFASKLVFDYNFRIISDAIYSRKIHY